MSLRKLLLAFGLFFTPSLAAAECAGTDLVPTLRQNDPEGWAKAVDVAAAVENGEGILWRVEAEGAPPSHLVGTFHVRSLAEAPRGEETRALAEAARLVLVEVTAAGVAELASTLPTSPDLLLNASPRPLADWLEPALAERAEGLLAGYGIAPASAAMLQPWFLSLLVALPPCATRADPSGLAGMDHELEKAAAAARGLETWREQIDMLRAGTEEEQRQAFRLALAIPHAGEDLLATQSALYESERIALIWELYSLLAGPTLPPEAIAAIEADAWQVLIADRNVKMADNAAPELRKGGVLMAVGALHLIGEDGLVALLRSKGFSVERVAR